MELNIFNANAFNITIGSKKAFVYEQEHCSILEIEGEKDFIVGDYYFPFKGATSFTFTTYGNPQTHYNCKVTAYSHDYGKTFTEVE